jgi:predicted dehydrogenase
MAVYDDTDPEMPVRVYDKGVLRPEDGEALMEDAAFARHNLELRAGDMIAPKVVGREPLRLEIEDFVRCIREGGTPVSDGHAGRDVVAVLEAADKSSMLGGQPMVPAREHDARTAA